MEQFGAPGESSSVLLEHSELFWTPATGQELGLDHLLQECWLLCSTGTLHLPAGVFCLHTGALLLVLLLSHPRVLEGCE